MTLVAHSPDLTQLIEEGYDIEVRGENLLVHHVPYVNDQGQADHCILVSELSTNGERTIAPGRHEVWVVGSVPHDHLGKEIGIIADKESHDYGDGIVACCRLSGKPGNQMPRDYHHKITTYTRILGQWARAINPSIRHDDFPARETSPEESVFVYHDAATSRAGLSAVTAKLRLDRVAIVGLGGTGSFILDLIAKTPVQEIHLFDDDVLYAHNAFRAPGAASIDQVKASPAKVDYFASVYSAFRRNITPHPLRIDESTIDQLRGMTFVFLSMDAGPAKRLIIESLQAWGLPFIDCGVGLQRDGNSLRGTVRVTAGAPGRYEHVGRRISFADVTANEYDWNIQTADLNMLNAVMAVIRWKKMFGYYVDDKDEFNSAYVVSRNQLNSGELPV